jgi:arylsulfatase A-like enzyme
MDDAVGKLLDGLDTAGVTENTIVIFTSDKGGWAYSPAGDRLAFVKFYHLKDSAAR